MTVIALADTGRPKRDIIEMAYEELGSAGYEFERTAGEIDTGLRRLNLMQSEWPWSLLPYNFPDMAEGSPAELSGLPDDSLEAVSLELARRLAGVWRVQFSPDQSRRAALAKSYLTAAYTTPPKAIYARNTPRGQGNRWMSRIYGPFINGTFD